MVTSYNNDATIGAQMLWGICGMEHMPDTALGGHETKIRYSLE